MNVLVRNLKSGKYLKSSGVWTDKIEEAHDFQTTQKAISTRGWGNDDTVEIVLSFGDKEYEIKLRLNPSDDSIVQE